MPITTFDSLLADPLFLCFFQSFIKNNDKGSDSLSFYLSCVNFKKDPSRKEAEMIYEQYNYIFNRIFTYGNIPIKQSTIDEIQTIINNRNIRVFSDLYQKAENELYEYLKDEFYETFMHSEILNSLYSILPEYLLIII